MQPVLLPSSNMYVSVDTHVLDWAMLTIDHQFRDLLENGAQANGLPDATYAAGQHLNPYSLNQRGFYGTAAALLVLARSRPAPRRIEFVEGLIRYVNSRTEIEEALARTDEDRAGLTARLLRERRTAFKSAELLYALSAAPPATAGREVLLRNLMVRLTTARRPHGGWAADLEPMKDHDALATASVVRGLYAAGVSVDNKDLELVRFDAENALAVSPYVRVFCLLVLLEIYGSNSDLTKLWTELFDHLRPEFHDRTEANYEFTLGNRHDYIRVPWQLYLIACAAICRPLSLVFESEIRRALLDAIRSLGTNDGYVYRAFGHMKSTRTYGILMDTLWRVQKQLDASRYVARLSTIVNVAIRILYSRTFALLALMGSFALIGLAVYSWVRGAGAFGAVAPEMLSAVLLGTIGFLLGRVRRRR